MTMVESDQPTSSAPKAWRRRRSGLGDHVARTVGILQARVLASTPDPAAISVLARLRRGIGRTPGFDFTLDQYLQVPDALLGTRPSDDSQPADSEHAVHDAITLYALHQQSRRERMHVDGRGLGQALADLAGKSKVPEGVRRRFAALGTASTYHESIYHLRGLITMLRGEQVPLDYGLLASDLWTLRQPNGRPQVQATWGREFFRARPAASPATKANEEDVS